MYLPKSLDNIAKTIISKLGYTLYRRSSPHSHLDRRKKIIDSYGIKLILDVGANAGQFAKSMRQSGYRHAIVSFEPMAQPFSELAKYCASDAHWECKQIALGDREEELKINVSENSISSSILPMLHEHLENAPRSKFISSQPIMVHRLDDLDDWRKWSNQGPIFLKIDVQGFEDRVLNGARESLKYISAIQLELSLKPLYEGQLTMLTMMQFLHELGFDPVAFEQGFTDKRTGESLQVDGIFRNRRMLGMGPSSISESAIYSD